MSPGSSPEPGAPRLAFETWVPAEAKQLGDELGLMVFKDLMTKNRGKLSFAGRDE
jgi:hypothetical protein